MNQNDNDSFDWQRAQEHDMRLAEMAFARKLSRAETTTDDALEYLVCHGWTKEEAEKALGLK